MEKVVGKVIRIEWDSEADEVHVVINIIDPIYKRQVIFDKTYESILTVKGRDAVVVATKSKINDDRS